MFDVLTQKMKQNCIRKRGHGILPLSRLFFINQTDNTQDSKCYIDKKETRFAPSFPRFLDGREKEEKKPVTAKTLHNYRQSPAK